MDGGVAGDVGSGGVCAATEDVVGGDEEDEASTSI